MDKWQYFAHRYMHQNKFLYRHVHSQHHRLVVPYAIGALYNHPLEGLLLDTLGGAIRSSSQEWLHEHQSFSSALL
jgi:sphinganine C4-monooxygenase